VLITCANTLLISYYYTKPSFSSYETGYAVHRVLSLKGTKMVTM